MLPDHVMTQDQELAESEVHDVNDGQFSEAIGMLSKQILSRKTV